MDRPLPSAKTRLLLAFTPAAIVVILGVVTAAGFWRVRGSHEAVVHTREVLTTADSVLQRLTDAETGQRGFIITGDSGYLAPYHGAKTDVERYQARLRRLTMDNPAQTARIDTLHDVVRARLDTLDGRIEVRAKAGFDSARTRVVKGGGRELMARARELLAAITHEERALLAARETSESRASLALAIVIGLGTVGAAGASIAINRLLLRLSTRDAAHIDELGRQNARLQDQAMELELQQQQLQEQAVELETQTVHLQDQTTELEAINEQLHATTEQLEERTRLAESLQQRAEDANRAKSDFLAMMSHELRTPLNAIAGYVELIEMGLRGPVTSEQLDDLRRVRQNGRHLLAIINDVLNFARLEAGRIELRTQPVPLSPFIAELHALVAPLLDAAGLAYSVRADFGSGEHPEALADVERLRQIVVNLLTNAIKFTPRGGRVDVRCGCDSREVWLSVSDTGRGIAPAKLETIFEPFVQVDRHLSDLPREGIGLGLAISRELARAMGGELTVASTEARGSTFTLRLPRAAAVHAPAGASTTAEARRSTPA